MLKERNNCGIELNLQHERKANNYNYWFNGICCNWVGYSTSVLAY